MKVQFVYRENGEVVERGNVYDVLSTDEGWYRILTNDGVASYYPASVLEVVEEYPPAPEIHYGDEDLDADGSLVA